MTSAKVNIMNDTHPKETATGSDQTPVNPPTLPSTTDLSTEQGGYGSLEWFLNGVSLPEELHKDIVNQLRQKIIEAEPSMKEVTAERLTLIRKALVENKTALKPKTAFAFLGVVLKELAETKDESPALLLARAIRIFNNILRGKRNGITVSEAKVAAFRAHFRHVNDELTVGRNIYQELDGLERKKAIFVHLSKTFRKVDMGTLHLLWNQAKDFFCEEEALHYSQSISSLDNLFGRVQSISEKWHGVDDEPGWVKVDVP
ncbi:uncharacterized protein BO97DRAFT_429714 [Aspergillus homomorphus CBS 101889]|uniref:Uncharacterized protein n=1 Tax=Aspergillus homomorphus (strain CBS 101889) TaxID=1450537 RepID=A0A395HHR0_ASPHC|nr:hypothetical protein BO97DRAFT_429714 [Aspergillus homomorphus CBS 101889]RAL07043.1 hypothetical protein BO97DRAFT_429714 [Aspergillus homomorphus CBS 101889]